ncbi:MAG: diaminopimelate decarboxylase [Hyphomicrobiaceae bacterium]
MAAPKICTNLQRALAELGCAERPQLAVDGVSAMALAESFGTPLYVFSADTLRRRVERIRAALGPRFELLWSVKANPSIAVTECLRLAGTGAEIASAGELEVALAAGHPAEHLRFAGPGKSDAELMTALARGLGTFHVESLDELQQLAQLSREHQLAHQHQHPTGVAIRVNLPQELKGSRMRMGGRSSRFGIDSEHVPEAVRMIQAHDALTLRGLHVYGGTQCFDAAAFVAHATALTEQAARWEEELEVRFDELDLGGGFGVAVFQGDPTFDLELAAAGLHKLLAQHDRKGRRWFIELGRYLAAPAGVFLSRVVRQKTSGELQHVVLDGGMHQAAAAAGLGTIVKRPPLLVAAEQLQESTTRPVTIGGPLCTPADQFAEQIELPTLQTGDLVAILNTGAYGLTYSPTGFLSHATPAEVMVEDGKPRVVRSRGLPQDALRGQRH